MITTEDPNEDGDNDEDADHIDVEDPSADYEIGVKSANSSYDKTTKR